MLFISCAFYGITNDYNKLPERLQSKIKKTSSFSDIEKEFVYEITGKDLRQELKKHNKSLVYIYTGFCNSALCLPLTTYENYAEKYDYDLFLIMDGYAHLKYIDTTIQSFSINTDYYDVKNRSKYVNSFKNELLQTKENKFTERVFFFQNDSLTSKNDNLPNNF